MAVKLKTNRHFISLLRVTLGPFLVLRYGARAENKALVKNLEPPYAIMPNHVGFWDPFLINRYVPHLIQYVVSDFQFRIPIMKFLLSLVGAIPKSKAISDFETVRNIFRVKANRGVIGIFPEGMRNWDGCSLPPLYATSKLVKALKIPVVVPILKGAYMMLPRWKRKPNRGKMTIEFRLGFNADEVKKMNVDEIHQRLGELIKYNEWEYQREKMHSYRGRKRAEHIELVLFTCPKCRAIGAMRSNRHTLHCSSCGYTLIYNAHGFFENPDGSGDGVFFDNVRDWNVWQLEHLSSLIEEGKKDPGDAPLFSDEGCAVWRGYRREPMQLYAEGTATLFKDRIEIKTADETIVHPIDEVHGINVQVREVVEYYYQEGLYMFRFANPWVSGFKWMTAVNLLLGKEPVNAEFFG
ncbi:MAG: 1-acyl-sn-glycerol-3-phosphate acyltransferase [Spirochaetales bacterium]|nr:1-acyl-sn-glycerol-3-phosphate acyltransferase [Spirochaetales bacterium]